MLLYLLGKRKWSVYAIGDQRTGSCEVLDLLEGNGGHGEALLARLQEHVVDHGPGHNEEFTKHLRDHILEFRRPSGKGGTLRVLYFFDIGHVVVCACACLKKSNKTPNELIERAVKLRDQYLRAKESGNLSIEELQSDGP